MKQLLRRMILGTALEPLVRRLLVLARPGGTNPCDLYDVQTIEVMRRVLTRTSNCIDIGCHTGAILRHMVRLAPLGVALAFEPIPLLAENLKRQFPDRSRVRVYEVALSDQAGTSIFHLVRGMPALSGLQSRDIDPSTIDRIPVRTEKLDALVPPELSIRFIKIDVEGAELQVLRGGVETIRRNQPFIVFEHGKGGADHFGTVPDQVYDLLVTECGLRISLMADWLRDAASSSLARAAFRREFDTHRNYYFMAHP